jgi:hypothetical protein
MRIFSNIILTWTQVIHVSQAARLYPGKWHNYYFYRIASRNPTRIITYSPVYLLQKNKQYYCYNRLCHDPRAEKQGNATELVSVNNLHHSLTEELYATIPKIAQSNDIIAISTIHYTGYHNFNYSPASLFDSTSVELI